MNDGKEYLEYHTSGFLSSLWFEYEGNLRNIGTGLTLTLLVLVFVFEERSHTGSVQYLQGSFEERAAKASLSFYFIFLICHYSTIQAVFSPEPCLSPSHVKATGEMAPRHSVTKLMRLQYHLGFYVCVPLLFMASLRLLIGSGTLSQGQLSSVSRWHFSLSGNHEAAKCMSLGKKKRVEKKRLLIGR